MGFSLSTLTSLIKSDALTSVTNSGVLGVDIGSSSIKIVQLRDVKGIPTLETYGELQLGPYEGINLGRITQLSPQKKVEALVDILREAGASARDVAFSFSYNACFTTIIQIPTIDQEKLNTMVPIEARKYVPVSLSKVELTWSPLIAHNESKTTSVLISAIYNEAQQQYVSIMQDCKLKTVASEIETFSMIRSVLVPEDDIVAIIDCGASSTRVCIVKKGLIIKTHSTLLSGVDLTTALAKVINVEFKDAEELKRTVGLHGKEKDPRIQKVIIATLDRGLREIHTVIKRYEESERETVQKVVLCGSGAQLQGFDSYIKDMFSRPVTKANSFSKVAYPAFLEDTLTQAGPSFAVAIGVALRTFQKK